MTLGEYVDFFDFSYAKDEEGFYLIDNQGADLGSIGSERFETAADVVERFIGSIYFPDYIVDDLEKEYGYNGDYSVKNLLEFAQEHSSGHAKILEVMVNPNSIVELETERYGIE